MELHDYQKYAVRLSKNIQSQHSFWTWDLVRRYNTDRNPQFDV